MRHVRWKEEKGDETYALDWPLNKSSLVWEIGGYEGRWAKQMYDRFACKIHIFEPQDWAVKKLYELFKDASGVIVHNHGLWVRDCSLPMREYETDGASIVKPTDFNNDIYFAPMKTIDTFLVDEVDVALMNIEGGEYILIPYLIGTGLIKRFKHFWAQFHGFFDPDGAKGRRIREQMSLTHNVLWDAYTTAIAWERKW